LATSAEETNDIKLRLERQKSLTATKTVQYDNNAAITLTDFITYNERTMTDARNANHRQQNRYYYTKDDDDDTAQTLHC